MNGDPNKSVTWIELCAGSAAVALVLLLGEGAEAPVPYLGGKRKLACLILSAFGLRPGQGASKVILIEQGIWAEVHIALRDEGGEVLLHLLELQRRMARDYRSSPFLIWRELHSEPVPEPRAQRVATWLALQSGAAAGKPVHIVNNRWKSAGYAAITEKAAERGYHERPQFDRIIRLTGKMIDAWRSTELVVIQADLSTTRIHHLLTDADLDGAKVIIDPPYAKSRSRYPASLGREEVMAAAIHCRRGKAIVGICESERIRPVRQERLKYFWPSIDLSEAQGTWCGKKGASEWLTISRLCQPFQASPLFGGATLSQEQR